jgi:predicted nuclease with TOPRIM domain
MKDTNLGIQKLIRALLHDKEIYYSPTATAKILMSRLESAKSELVLAKHNLSITQRAFEVLEGKYKELEQKYEGLKKTIELKKLSVATSHAREEAHVENKTEDLMTEIKGGGE